MKTIVIRAAVYFALVFGAGFLLGTIRVLALVPRWGERTAELIEAPLMLTAIYLAARFVTRRLPATRRLEYLSSGLLALVLLLAVEFSVVLHLRGIGIDEYLATRDPVSGAVYATLLMIFALMPWWLAGRPGHARSKK